MVAPNAVSREQAYLTSVANQPKDIDPDRIYEVSWGVAYFQDGVREETLQLSFSQLSLS